MKFTEALEIISNDSKKRMYRDEWAFDLYFHLYDWLIIEEQNGDSISPYTIHAHDFAYDWKIKE